MKFFLHTFVVPVCVALVSSLIIAILTFRVENCNVFAGRVKYCAACWDMCIVFVGCQL